MISVKCQEKCGIAAVIAPRGKNAAPIAAKVSAELQHRGQEGSGMGTKVLGGDFALYRESRRFGLAFSSESVLTQHNLAGEIAIGHTRYRTEGPADNVYYAQPMLV